MSYGRIPQFGEVYQVDLPVIGKSDVTIPTSKLATDFISASVATLEKQSPKLTASLMKSLIDNLPLILDRSVIEAEKRLASSTQARKNDLQRGLVITGACMAAVIVGGAIWSRGKK